MTDSPIPAPDYAAFLESLKDRVRRARLRAGLSVNRELVLLYWDIGRDILERQATQGWGAKVIDRLSRDLRREFPDMKGFSPRNLKYMRAFAEAWPEPAFVQQVVAQIPWGHSVRILDKAGSAEERVFYVHKTLEHGWSRDMLLIHMERGLYSREGRAVNNFEATLPPAQSDLARQTLKDPYTFDFLTIADDARERELERGLVGHIRDFLLELGVGFAFLGSQVRVEVSGRDFYLDMLFYHVKLRCFVVLELKAGDFEPEYAGKMSFYLSAVDDHYRHATDNPSIGLVLCRRHDKVIVEYALRESNRPIGVAAWQLTRALPDHLSADLPTVDTLEEELGDLTLPDSGEDDE